jgi:hypothetical protein
VGPDRDGVEGVHQLHLERVIGPDEVYGDGGEVVFVLGDALFIAGGQQQTSFCLTGGMYKINLLFNFKELTKAY